MAFHEATRRFRFDHFDEKVEEYDYYIRRFECELAVFGLLDDDNAENARRDLLLSKIGAEPFKVLVDGFRPDDPRTKTYVELKTLLCSYYSKRVCVIAERTNFTQRSKKEGETVIQFLNSLRSLAGNCDFGNSLNERLRDQLVIGINDASWQQELFRKHPDNTATLKEVEQTALVLEQASIQQKRLQTMGKMTTSDESTTRRVNFNPGSTRPQHSGRNVATAKRTIRADNDCLRCGRKKHKKGDRCPAESKKCNECREIGHFAAVCLKSGRAEIEHPNGPQGNRRHANMVHQDIYKDNSESDDGNEWEGHLNVVHAMRNVGKKATVIVQINGVPVEMLYDPGAAQSVISEKVWKTVGTPVLAPTPPLVAYTKVPVETIGRANVRVEAFGQSKKLQLFVIKPDDVSLFGLDWCLDFGLKLPKGVTVHNVKSSELGSDVKSDNLRNAVKTERVVGQHFDLNHLLDQYSDIFSEQTGTIVGHRAVIHIDKTARKRVFNPRPVPFSLKTAVEEEIERLVKNDIIESVDSATMPIEWASPIVCVVKSTGAIRICGDFKVTINPHITSDPHPLPRFEEITAQLNGGRYFSVIDLKDAYLQMSVEEESRKFLVIATHKGYYRYKRLPFGVSFAPALFQKTMEQILAGLEGTAVYIDDIIVVGDTMEQHLDRLSSVFDRLRQANVHTHVQKCKFMKDSVTYLGHRIDSTGIHPTEERIEAIQKMPSPTNVSELRSFIGVINYYAKFIPHLQGKCSTLHRLTKKGVTWRWTPEDEHIAKELKTVLTSSETLVHYDGALPLVLSTDACDRGLGAALMHVFPDGTEKPIAYASRTLSDTEKRYSAIDKEALGIIFGITKFGQYLFGRHFTLKTDHKPLERIFGENREIPKMAANRLMRWALILSAYDYDIKYVQGKDNAVADVLSRLPLNIARLSPYEEMGSRAQLLNIKLDDMPISRSILQNQTIKDPILSRVIAFLDRGWPSSKDNLPKELFSFYEKRNELSFEEKTLLWQGRIVIPTASRESIMNMLHEGHPGICAMKSIARFQVWWPGIDVEIENFVKCCDPCQEIRPDEPEVPLFSWNVPSEPWTRLHIDYAGPFEGRHWLLIVDACSKWMEIFPTNDTTSKKTIKFLREVFARFGLPRSIVSDNGPQFVSEEFEEFCRTNNVTHIRSTPYHPKTNGLAERAVQTFKKRFASARDIPDVDLRLQRFLISYRNTPHKTTGRTPAELLIGRRLRTRIDLLKPSVDGNIDRGLHRQYIYHDQHAKFRSFFSGEEVWVAKPDGKGRVPGKVIQRTGEYSYTVMIDGVKRRKHADQMSFKMSKGNVYDSEEQPEYVPCNPPRTENPGKFSDPELPPTIPDKETAGYNSEEASVQPDVETTDVVTKLTQTEKIGQNLESRIPLRERAARDRGPPRRPYDDYLTGKRLK